MPACLLLLQLLRCDRRWEVVYRSPPSTGSHPVRGASLYLPPPRYCRRAEVGQTDRRVSHLCRRSPDRHLLPGIRQLSQRHLRLPLTFLSWVLFPAPELSSLPRPTLSSPAGFFYLPFLPSFLLSFSLSLSDFLLSLSLLFSAVVPCLFPLSLSVSFSRVSVRTEPPRSPATRPERASRAEPSEHLLIPDLLRRWDRPFLRRAEHERRTPFDSTHTHTQLSLNLFLFLTSVVSQYGGRCRLTCPSDSCVTPTSRQEAEVKRKVKSTLDLIWFLSHPRTNSSLSSLFYQTFN